MNETLRTCPFCGSNEMSLKHCGWVWVVCDVCNSVGTGHYEESMAILAWNTRPTEDKMGEIIHELEDRIFALTGGYIRERVKP